MKPNERLPPIDAALVIVTVGMETWRERHGMKECRDAGIGARRRKLGSVPSQPLCVALISPVEKARNEARALLESMCAICPFRRCKMKRWPATA